MLAKAGAFSSAAAAATAAADRIYLVMHTFILSPFTCYTNTLLSACVPAVSHPTSTRCPPSDSLEFSGRRFSFFLFFIFFFSAFCFSLQVPQKFIYILQVAV